MPEGKPAVTEFIPVAYAGGYTMVRGRPQTGRRHQIRVHAAWPGYPVAGDKLYGGDPGLMLRLVENGFSGHELAGLPILRHALHAAEAVYGEDRFEAPLFADIVQFSERSQSGL